MVEPLSGDVAVKDGAIAEVGKVSGHGRGKSMPAAVRDAGLRRHPHPLRRPGDVGLQPPHPRGRRDHRRDGQLRCRLRPVRKNTQDAVIADGRGGHPGPACTKISTGAGRVFPTTSPLWAPQPRHRFLRPAAAAPMRVYVMGDRALNLRTQIRPTSPRGRNRRGCGACRRVRLSTSRTIAHKTWPATTPTLRAGSRAHGDRHGVEGCRKGSLR